MSDPEHLPIPSAPPYGDYVETTRVVSTPADDFAPPPAPRPAPPCSKTRTFHMAVANHDYDLVSHFLTSTPPLATPNSISCSANTPLFTAVRVRDIKMARLLITHGADVNGWSSPLYTAADPNFNLSYDDLNLCLCNAGEGVKYAFSAMQCGEQIVSHWLDVGLVPRTPLMEAASTGQIAMVKLLMNEYQADDTLVSPDGQTALRLAAANKHRDIVAFLPARRLGAFKRIKFRSRKAMRRVKAIALKLYDIGKFFVWDLPKFFLWTIPKEISLWIWRGLTWKNFIRVGRFFFWRVPKFFLYHLPKFFLWDVPKYFITEFPWAKFGRFLRDTVKDVARWFWEDVIKQIPGFLKRMAIRVYDLLATFVNRIREVVERFFSLLHTIALAVWTFLKEVTLRDVWNAICDLCRAIFRNLPRAVWEGIKAVYRVLNRTFRYTLEMAWEVAKGVYRVVVYVPKQLLRICKEVGAVVVRLGKEVIVCVRPKVMLV
ncbi:uncharacterized protein EV420DRAFT_1341856 [Desarmillaria tabescens]|uniref:Ankyrin n=1 Tax=Armillaria tabescens TaxID=1929756 RepID=A0AA39JFA1_ARMTA|nr:uncharacterized protein EV420DRAFT_1341856 [Desarmillaria tabescens]KAK0439513.1 hypothetical protein EV420DRAFT_1341856 [Desarmillaria tabescens]